MTEVTESTAPQRSGKADEDKSSFRLPAFLNNSLTVAGVVVLLTVILYWRITNFSFINYDDDTNIFKNPHLNPVTLQGMGYLWTHGYYELYMPLTYTLWGLCSYLFPVPQGIYVLDAGKVFVNPAAFHALSLLLHSINTLLVFMLIKRIVKKPWPAGVGAALFAIHPVQVESVAWITGTNNLTSGFFGLIALLLYLSAAEAKANNTSTARLRYGGATLFFILALLSKPTAVAIPLVAAAIDWGVLGRPPVRWVRWLLPWIILALALAVITHFTSETSQKLHLALWVRPFIAGDALAYYISKLLWPFNLSLLNAGRSMYLVKASWWGYVTWIVPAAIGWALWRIGSPARILQTGILVFVLALLPMLGFVVFYGMADSTVSSRYLYLAMLGIGIAATWFAGNERINYIIRSVTCGLSLVLLTGQTVHVIPNWQDSATLAEAQVVINPNDDIAQLNSGIFLSEKGKAAEALPHFKAAVKLKPDNAMYQYQLGAALEEAGDLKGAVTALREAVRLDPSSNERQVNLGGVLLKLGKNNEAIETLSKAVKITPNDFSVIYLLGIALAKAERYPESEKQFRRVLLLTSQMPQAKQALARVLEKQGRKLEAVKIYQEILKATPDDKEAAKGLERTLSKIK